MKLNTQVLHTLGQYPPGTGKRTRSFPRSPWTSARKRVELIGHPAEDAAACGECIRRTNRSQTRRRRSCLVPGPSMERCIRFPALGSQYSIAFKRDVRRSGF